MSLDGNQKRERLFVLLLLLYFVLCAVLSPLSVWIDHNSGNKILSGTSIALFFIVSIGCGLSLPYLLSKNVFINLINGLEISFLGFWLGFYIGVTYACGVYRSCL